MPSFEDFTLFVKNLEIEPEDILEAGKWLAGERYIKSYSGQDVDGGQFAPYSPDYAFRKGSSAVNLYSAKDDEHMLSAIQAKVDGDVLQVGIFDNEELATRARVINEGGLIPTHKKGITGSRSTRKSLKKIQRTKAVINFPARHWLGASQEDLDTMAQIIEQRVEDRLKNSGG